MKITLLLDAEASEVPDGVTDASFIPTTPVNTTAPKQNSTGNGSLQSSSWYNYWSTPKPSAAPTQQPSVTQTDLPTSDPTESPSFSANAHSNSKSSSNYQVISSVTALISIVVIAAALFITKRHLLKKKKMKKILSSHSPTVAFCDMSKRIKQRKKLMEEYFEVEAVECNPLNRSAASSLDFQISTEFIDISHEKQQSIY